MTNCGVPFMKRATGSVSITVLNALVQLGHSLPFVLIRSSWMVPSRSGSARASFTSRCCSSSDSAGEARARDRHLKMVAAAGAVLDVQLGRVGERLLQ